MKFQVHKYNTYISISRCRSACARSLSNPNDSFDQTFSAHQQWTSLSPSITNSQLHLQTIWRKKITDSDFTRKMIPIQISGLVIFQQGPIGRKKLRARETKMMVSSATSYRRWCLYRLLKLQSLIQGVAPSWCWRTNCKSTIGSHLTFHYQQTTEPPQWQYEGQLAQKFILKISQDYIL